MSRVRLSRPASSACRIRHALSTRAPWRAALLLAFMLARILRIRFRPAPSLDPLAPAARWSARRHPSEAGDDSLKMSAWAREAPCRGRSDAEALAVWDRARADLAAACRVASNVRSSFTLTDDRRAFTDATTRAVAYASIRDRRASERALSHFAGRPTMPRRHPAATAPTDVYDVFARPFRAASAAPAPWSATRRRVVRPSAPTSWRRSRDHAAGHRGVVYPTIPSTRFCFRLMPTF